MTQRTIAMIACAFLLATNPLSSQQREIQAGANAIRASLNGKPVRTIAVVDFTDLRGRVTELGRFIAEEVALGLALLDTGLTVIDRTHLKTLMQEHRLGASGVIDPVTARKLGQIAGVQALVTGSITPFADNVRVVVKVLDAETAQIVAATSIDITKNRTIEELLKQDVPGTTGEVSTKGASVPPPSPAASPAGSVSVQNGRLRVTANQLSVSSDNERATVSLIVQNISADTVYLASEYTTGGIAALSDDRGTGWYLTDTRGIAVIDHYGGLERVKDTEMAALGPTDSVTVILTFKRNSSSSVQTPGTSFTVTMNGLVSTGSGARRISLGVSGIKPSR